MFRQEKFIQLSRQSRPIIYGRINGDWLSGLTEANPIYGTDTAPKRMEHKFDRNRW